MSLKTISRTVIEELPWKEIQMRKEANGSLTTLNTFREPVFYSAFQSRTTSRQVPGWRKRIVLGYNSTTTLTGENRKFEIRPGYFYKVVRQISPTVAKVAAATELTGIFCRPNLSMGAFPSTLTTQANNQALAGFVKKVVSSQHQLQGMVSGGELFETLRMLSNPGKALREGIKDYLGYARGISRRSVSNRKKKRILRDSYLEAVFGWLPLISDIEGARQAYSKLGSYQPWKFIRFTSEKSSVESDTALNSSSYTNSMIVDARQLAWFQATSSYCGVVDLVTDPLGFRLASQNFGFDWQNFIPTVWELIPYSFVADYFSNIGEMVTAASLNTARIRWVAKTSRTSRNIRIYDHHIRPNVHSALFRIEEQQLRPDQFTYRSETVNRSDYTGSLVPDFQVEIPGFLSDARKWLNMAALLRFRRL